MNERDWYKVKLLSLAPTVLLLFIYMLEKVLT